MGKVNRLSLLAALAIGLDANFVFAANPKILEVSGDLRAGYVYYDYNTAMNPVSKGFYTTPKLSITTGKLDGFSVKVTGAFATDIGFNEVDKQYGNYVLNKVDPISYAILQEAYIKYESKWNDFRIGREEIDTPMISNDDYYMLADTYEVVHYTNTMIENMMFTAGYVRKMAGVWDSGAYDGTKAPLGGTEFYSMTQASYVSSADKARAKDTGAAYFGYNYIDGMNKVQLWVYRISDLYDILFSQYDFTNKTDGFSYDAGVQAIVFQERGALKSHDDTEIDYNVVSAKFDGSFDNGFGFGVAAMKFSDGPGQGATIAAFGGYPFFAFGNIVHWFGAGSFQNAANYKAQVSYDLGKVGVDGLSVFLKHVYTDLDPKFSKFNGVGQDFQKTYDLMFNYSGSNGLYANIQYQYADIDKKDGIHGFRLIGGYRF